MESCYKQKQREDIYRIYVTDSFKALARWKTRYVDLVDRKDDGITEENAKEKAEEIKQNIVSKIRGLGGG